MGLAGPRAAIKMKVALIPRHGNTCVKVCVKAGTLAINQSARDSWLNQLVLFLLLAAFAPWLGPFQAKGKPEHLASEPSATSERTSPQVHCHALAHSDWAAEMSRVCL